MPDTESDANALKPIIFRYLGGVGPDPGGNAERFALIGRALAAGNWGDLTPEAVQWYVRAADDYRHAVMHAMAGVAQVWNGLIPPSR